MANIPGGVGVLPGVFTDVITQSRGVSVPGGTRIAAMIGEGSTDETLVSQATGGGKDGLNGTYTGTSGRDGRHFRLLNAPVISNRTSLFKNGRKLVGTESLIDTNSFSNNFDYRIDITTGQIELQTAHIQDQGGSFSLPLSTNVGAGSITNPTLVDINSPPETWTVRCISVLRNNLGQPISTTAKFLAFGSVSGAKLDANGNPVVWLADGYQVSNGIIKFSIADSVPVFREGDSFSIKIASGVLVRNDSLTVNYIPVINLNDPVLLQGMGAVAARHGFPSISNSLSLGAQLAFANSAPALMTLQAAPSMPRRTPFVLSPSVNSLALNNDEFMFPLPLGVTPDFNSQIHFFVTDNTKNIETQVLPNKLDYYLLGTPNYPTVTNFINDNNPSPSGSSYFYTVHQSFETFNTGNDGYIGRIPAFTNQGLFSSSVVFDNSYIGRTLKIIDTNNSSNFGLFHITAVNGGRLYFVADGTLIADSGSVFNNPSFLSDFLTESSVSFQVINPVTGLQVGSFAGTNGALVPSGGSTGDGYLSSATVNFSTIPSITNYKLKISGSTTATAAAPYGNNGLYDIVSTTGTGVNIKKAIVDEKYLEYEIIDGSLVTNYIVVNRHVVPAGYGLRVTLIDFKDAKFYDAGWIKALKSLEKVECDILVALPKQTISVIFQNALNHCKSMSNIRNKKERVLFAGAINGLTPDNLIGAKDAAVEDIGILEGIQGENTADIFAGNIEDLSNYSVADSFGNTFRCVYFYPDQIVVQAGTDNVLIDGFYQAAAAAGFESADVRLENPLTNKVLSGFTILRDKQFSPLILEQLAAAGVTTLQPVSGGGRVVWGRTTTQSGFPEEEEISIVFIRDRVAKTLRAGFEGFIGNAESPDTQAILNTRAVILLNSLVSQGLITKYIDLSVNRDGVDPRQWNIAVRVQPTYPINFIYIKVSLGQL